jgi:hypothetical protein
MAKNKRIAEIVLAALAVSFLAFGAPALASEDMKLGVAEYNAGDYKSAAGHLGLALPTDFNNAVLHYYLANTYVHLNIRDGAVREFRIAYALEPDKEVGRLSKLALKYMGISTDDKSSDEAASAKGGTGKLDNGKLDSGKLDSGKSPNGNGGAKSGESRGKEAGGKGESTQKSDGVTGMYPRADKSAELMRQKSEQEKAFRQKLSSELAGETARRGEQVFDRTRSDINDSLTYWRRGRQITLPMPQDSIQQLEQLRRFYEGQKSAHIEEGAHQAMEIQKTADNLDALLHEKNSKTTPKLVPEGTNLYVRTYSKADSPEKGKAPAKGP